jgi:branched-subunit amino acid ABC-type transport system permease component
MLAMSSFGIAILLRGLVQTIFGTQLRSFDRISKPFLDLGLGIAVPPDLIFLGLTAIFLCFITHYILQYTKIGKSMRATSDNPDLAMVTGINVNKVIINTWILAACLAACAGILVSIFSAQFMPQMGWKLLIPIFAAVVLGGVGNAYGAFIGALIVGISMEVSTEYINPAYKLAIAFIIMLLVLLVKPRGLLGGKD